MSAAGIKKLLREKLSTLKSAAAEPAADTENADPLLDVSQQTSTLRPNGTLVGAVLAQLGADMLGSVSSR